MKIISIDHTVLTVRDIDTTADFYNKTPGIEVMTFGEGRIGLKFGSQKISLQQFGKVANYI